LTKETNIAICIENRSSIDLCKETTGSEINEKILSRSLICYEPT